MYESPITIKVEEIARNIMDRQEEYILTQVQMCVDVDKDELVKALQYDRRQYEKGYADGRANATKHGHWEWNDCGGFGNYHCTVCKYIPYGKFSWKFCPDYMYCPRCGAKMDEEVNENETD